MQKEDVALLVSGAASILTGIASFLNKGDQAAALSLVVVGLGLIGKALFKPSSSP